MNGLSELPAVLMDDRLGEQALTARQARFVLQQLAPMLQEHGAVLAEVICLREVLAVYRDAMKEVNDALFAETTQATLAAIATVVQALEDMEKELRANPETAGVAAT